MTNRVAKVSAAGSHDLNEELTIILNALEQVLEEHVSLHHPARQTLFEARLAAYRAALKVCGVQHYAHANGGRRRGAATLEEVLEKLK